MFNYVTKLVALLLLTSAFIVFNLGMDYINFGYGINPYIAFVVTIVLLMLALISWCWCEFTDDSDVGEYDNISN